MHDPLTLLMCGGVVIVWSALVVLAWRYAADRDDNPWAELPDTENNVSPDTGRIRADVGGTASGTDYWPGLPLPAVCSIFPMAPCSTSWANARISLPVHVST